MVLVAQYLTHRYDLQLSIRRCCKFVGLQGSHGVVEQKAVIVMIDHIGVQYVHDVRLPKALFTVQMQSQNQTGILKYTRR